VGMRIHALIINRMLGCALPMGEKKPRMAGL
jgi:hypothetical protein